MTTYNPREKQDEVATSAAWEGAVNGAITLVPSCAGVWAAMKNPKFLRATNFQSRTALAVMPALFVFGFTAERKLEHDMKAMADEGASVWRKEQHAKQQRELQGSISHLSKEQASMMELYRTDVANSGVRVVPGDQLGFHHSVANYLQANPFKVLAAAGVPTVLYIFAGKSHQNHLQLQSKIMHTRVYGQFAVIGMLLSLMGFKQYMDSSGTFITEKDAQDRAAYMAQKREDLLESLEFQKKQEEMRKEMIRKAHDDDIQNKFQKKVANIKDALDTGDHSHAH